MSGHSKWSTIKRQKGAADAKRGAVFTKLANAITIAIKSHNNPATLIEKAKTANMPKDKIQRAIDRAASSSGGELSEAVFEGFGPNGVAIIIETVTDNVTRTSNELRSTFAKNGGNLGSPGSVSYLFTRVGEIEVEGENIFDKALEVGALDAENNIIYTKPEELHLIHEKLSKDLKVISSELVFKPNKETMIPADISNFLEIIDNLNDVQNIYYNALT